MSSMSSADLVQPAQPRAGAGARVGVVTGCGAQDVMVQALERRLAASETRAKHLELRLALSNTNAAEFETRLVASEAHARVLGSRLARSEELRARAHARPRTSAPTQRQMRRAFNAKVEELALTHARTTAQMLNVQKSCFEQELDALATEASASCTALENEVAALQAELARQQAELASMRSRAEAADRRYAHLRASIESAPSTVASHESDVSSGDGGDERDEPPATALALPFNDVK